MCPDAELHLVVVKWPKGEKLMMLLTTLNAVRTHQALWQVVQGYVTRWRVEETTPVTWVLRKLRPFQFLLK